MEHRNPHPVACPSRRLCILLPKVGKQYVNFAPSRSLLHFAPVAVGSCCILLPQVGKQYVDVAMGRQLELPRAGELQSVPAVYCC